MGARCQHLQILWRDRWVVLEEAPVEAPMLARCRSERTARAFVRHTTGDTVVPFVYSPVLLCEQHVEELAADLGWGQDALSRPLPGVAVFAKPRPEAFRADLS